MNVFKFIVGVFLRFQVEVQMADHALSAPEAIFEANFAVKMGEIIVTGTQKIENSNTIIHETKSCIS